MPAVARVVTAPGVPGRPGMSSTSVRRQGTAAAACAMALLLGSCSTGGGGDSDSAVSAPPSVPSTGGPTTAPGSTSPSTAPSPSTTGDGLRGVRTPTVAGAVATGLDAPWGLAFLPDGTALVSQRDRGDVVLVGAGRSPRVVGRVPGVEARSEGGLLGLATSPRFAQDRLVYAYFTAADDNRIARMRFDGGRLGPPTVVFSGIAKAPVHNGGRLAFGPDGMLYVGTGDAGERPRSQDRSSPNGKILRLTPDGDPAPGNPVPGNPMWSMGHRNVQGLAFDRSGRLWASEFGQNTWDELNLVQKGANYGWPEVEGRAGRAGFVDPVAQWRPEDASPSGIAVAGDAVFMAGLRGQRLWRIPTAGGPLTPFFVERYGRLRTVALAPDGSLWLATSNTDGRGEPRAGDDRILRLALG